MRVSVKILIAISLILGSCTKPRGGEILGKDYEPERKYSSWNPAIHMFQTKTVPEKWMVSVKAWTWRGDTLVYKKSVKRETWETLEAGDILDSLGMKELDR